MRGSVVVALLLLSACGFSSPEEPQPEASENDFWSERQGAATPAPGATASVATGTPKAAPPPVAKLPEVDDSQVPDDCGASRFARFMGKADSASVRGQVAQAAGSRTVRWIGPDTAVTLDFDPQRLNFTTDASGRIIGIDCS